MEDGVVLDEAYISSPQDQVSFQDPFAIFLEKCKRGVCYTMNSLLQSVRKNISTTVQKQVRWKWPFDFFNIIKELNQDQPCNHLLDWLYWKEEFTR